MICCSPTASLRIRRAREWLGARSPAQPVLIVGSHALGAHELIREAALDRGAALGWHAMTLGRLAAALATRALITRDAVPVSQLGCEAMAARVINRLLADGAVGRYAGVAATPGFSRALAASFTELRHAGVHAPALDAELAELGVIYSAYVDSLVAAGLLDRAGIFELATRTALDGASGDPLLGLPTLFLDVAVDNAAEQTFLGAVARRAPHVLATVPAADSRSAQHFCESLGVGVHDVERGARQGGSASLDRLHEEMFERGRLAPATLDDSVSVLSAPGEGRECVEIARRIHAAARRGIRFDRMAVLLRSPEVYQTHLAEAFRRAGIPAHFASAVRRPDPPGRAFYALLGCAAEGLSARRFAEYLSLGEVPQTDLTGGPPAPADERWVVADDELMAPMVADALAAELADDGPSVIGEPVDGDAACVPVTAAVLRAPRHWEKLLMEAAVIGGRQRWQRRLEGLHNEFELALRAFVDADDPAASRLQRDLADLAALRAYALPVLDVLEALPGEATWGEWIDSLAMLATRSLRRPERVLAVLSELVPLRDTGPVDLNEVLLVLESRLLEVVCPVSGPRYGRVMVAPVDAARGMSFDLVFVPGLAEKLFPRKIAEEPILLDEMRRRLHEGLVTNEQRIARERLAMCLAVGAAERELVLSYPRVDMEQGRPRVPSFYALEALRAAEGTLPGFDELAICAEQAASVHLGWPAPDDPADAIDEAEHDLALLGNLLDLAPEQSAGTARYLLEVNPHLGRALRFRARRWLRGWSVADGLVKPVSSALPAIAVHGLAVRSFSPTALQTYAACPYKFLLYAVHKLSPREVPQAIEELDPLQRGSLVHDVLFEFLSSLERDAMLPVVPQAMAAARDRLDATLDRVAAEYHELLAPAIERVWADGIAAIRADLREWLKRLCEDESGFSPWRFELSFGLGARRAQDPHSHEAPVALSCGISLRGSIDLIERAAPERLRVTDYKTGKNKVKTGTVIAGGEALQPVLYALAVEKLFSHAQVEAGRLYYCTSAGGFVDRVVALSDRARQAAQRLADTVGKALDEPFLPAAPRERACRWCDYNVVCGPHESLRVGRKLEVAKSRHKLEGLLELRSLP